MSHPMQLNKLQSAVQMALPDVRQVMQPNAAQCNPVRRAEGGMCETKPPRASPPMNSILSPRQQMAISLLLAGKQVKVVASELGIHRATVFRWKQDPKFQLEVRRRAELAGPMLRVRRYNTGPTGFSDPSDSDSDRPSSPKSLSELRESNRRLYERLAHKSSGRK